MSDKLHGGVVAGVSDVSLPVLLRKTADNIEKTGVAHTDVTARYWRQGGTPQSVSMSALSAIDDAHADGGWKEVDATNQPGLYRMDWPDTAFATGADWVILSIKVATCFVFHERFGLGSAETQLRSGTAQGGAAGTITLDAGASAVNDFYKHAICALAGGTGAGQAQIIDSYVGSTKVATMAANWATAPDNTTEFVILPLGTIPGASAPTAAQVADAVLTELVGDHKASGGSLADVLNQIMAATAAKKIVNDKAAGETEFFDTDGSTLLFTHKVQAGQTDDEVELVRT